MKLKNIFSFLKLIMIFKQELSPQNGLYTPLLCFHLESLHVASLLLILHQFCLTINKILSACNLRVNSFDQTSIKVIKIETNVIMIVLSNYSVQLSIVWKNGNNMRRNYKGKLWRIIGKLDNNAKMEIK